MPAPRKPQDRKPKASTGYTFTGVDGSTFELPAPTSAIENIPGRLLRDAIMDDGDGNADARLSFTVLERAKPDPAALEALYDLPVPQMLAVVRDWFQKARLDGEPLPS